jgi:chlorite dismutase
MAKLLPGAVALICLLAGMRVDAQTVSREKILKDPNVYAIFLTLKCHADFPSSTTRAETLSRELQSLIGTYGESVLADFYLTRGLEANSDVLVRVHSYDLARAQDFVLGLRSTTLGRNSDITDTFVGMTDALQYANRDPSLMDSLKATSYSDKTPRFVFMVPIKKSAEWWNLPMDARMRMIREHTVRTLTFLSTVKRKLYHSTGLDDVDFVTFFEVNDPSAFLNMSKVLMGVEENKYHVQWGHPVVMGRIETIDSITHAIVGE